MPSFSKIGGVILAGGASSRMGEDKALIDWNGRRAIDRLADLLARVGVMPFLVSGGDYGLPFAPDPYPQAGPVAGLKAALPALAAAGCDGALVLAVDTPTVRAADLAPLLAAPAPGATYEGLPLPMLAPADAPLDLPDDARLRTFIAGAGLAALPYPPGARTRLLGANTPNERAALLAEDRAAGAE